MLSCKSGCISFFIGVRLLYTVALVSAIQRGGSSLNICLLPLGPPLPPSPPAPPKLSEKEKQISYINAYTWNQKNDTNEPIFKAEIETERTDVWGLEQRVDELGDWG